MRTLRRTAILALFLLVLAPPGSRAALPDTEMAEAAASFAAPNTKQAAPVRSLRPSFKKRTAPLRPSTERSLKRGNTDPGTAARRCASAPERVSR
jgi:hypothetical protein